MQIERARYIQGQKAPPGQLEQSMEGMSCMPGLELAQKELVQKEPEQRLPVQIQLGLTARGQMLLVQKALAQKALEQNRPALMVLVPRVPPQMQQAQMGPVPERMLLGQAPKVPARVPPMQTALVQKPPVLKVQSTLEVQQERLSLASEPVPSGLMEN